MGEHMDIAQLLKSSGSTALEALSGASRKQETSSGANVVYSWGKDRVTISQAAQDAYAHDAQEVSNNTQAINCTKLSSFEFELGLAKRQLTEAERALAANDPDTSFKMTIGGKTVDILQSLRSTGEEGFAPFIEVMNALTHGSPDDFAQALSKALGVNEGDVKASLKGLDISQAAELAKKLGAFSATDPSAFMKSLSVLTGVDLAVLDKMVLGDGLFS